MKLRKNVVAGILLGIGIPISLLLAVDFLKKDNPNKADDVMAFVLFGLPPTVAGGLLTRSMYQEAQQTKLKREQQERDRLQSIFYQLLKAGNGRLTLLCFAMETQLSGEEAKQYLDQKAKEFDARFEVNDEGGVSYCFNLGVGSRELAPHVNKALTQEIFDVILEEVPADKSHEVYNVIEALTDLDWFKAVDLVQSLNSGAKPVQEAVDKAIAIFIKQKLKKAGAKVTIQPNVNSPKLTNSTNEVSSPEEFDVILERVSASDSIKMAQIIGVLIDQHWFKTSDLIDSLKSGPKPIKKRVEQVIAEFMRERMEKAGMKVTLKPSK